MSMDQVMEDHLIGRAHREASIPYRHQDPSTSFMHPVTDDHDFDIEIEIEEILDGDFEQGNDIKVLTPDECEEPPDSCLLECDPKSRTPTPSDPTAQHEYLIQGLRSLHCDDRNTKEEPQSWLWNNEHQWSMGTRKRSHSQSAGSGTEIRHAQPLVGYDLGSSARRLRRRVRERSNQNPSILGGTQAVNTIEIEEADGDEEVQSATPYTISRALEAEAVDELGDVMDMD